MIRRYWKMLVAVLGGNAIYFGLLYRYLPPSAQHQPSHLDLGLLIDFWICVALLGLLTFPFRRQP